MKDKYKLAMLDNVRFKHFDARLCSFQTFLCSIRTPTRGF